MRHGDIDDIVFKVKLDFIRDFRNVLGLLSDEDSIEFMDQLERDTTRQILAKLSTRKMKDGQESESALMPIKRFEGIESFLISQEA